MKTLINTLTLTAVIALAPACQFLQTYDPPASTDDTSDNDTDGEDDQDDDEDADGDGFDASVDCDDTDEDVGAPEDGEECRTEDECLDTNGSDDPEDWDCDNDGFRASVDCDDWDEDIGFAGQCPGDDADGDGVEWPLDCDDSDDDIGVHCDEDEDGYAADEDCDDNDPDINPGVAEECDSVDNDCDGFADEIASCDSLDEDGDGWFTPDDCNDDDASIKPDAHEVCADGIDQDCDGADVCTDADGDGSPEGIDCDDTDPSVSPDLNEVCDGVDNDCNGTVDDSATDEPLWYTDADDDGFGDPDGPKQRSCEEPTTGGDWADNDDDCDDSDDSLTDDCSGSTGSGGTASGLVDTGVCLKKDIVDTHAGGVFRAYGMDATDSVDTTWFHWDLEIVSNVAYSLETIGGDQWYCSLDSRKQSWDADHDIAINGFGDTTTGRLVDGYGPLSQVGLDPNDFVKITGGNQTECTWEMFSHDRDGDDDFGNNWPAAGGPTYAVVCSVD